MPQTTEHLDALAARTAERISVPMPDLAYEIGHGKNVVNVALVDLRGWDTMGELSVLVLAATGVASLVFVTHRSDLISRAISSLPTGATRTRRPLVETDQGPRPRTADSRSTRQAWLVGGQRVRPENRSIMLEVIVRILFHTIIVVSIYLLFAGHNLPGGGFAGGLVAGMALVMRYVAGGRYELGAAAPTDAGRLLGAGMTLAVGTAVVPLLFGAAPLTSWFWEAELPVLGHVEHHEPVLPVPVLMAGTLLVVAVGAVWAWLVYGRDEVPVVAPAGSALTRAARADLYQDELNSTLLQWPGIGITRGLTSSDRELVDGSVLSLSRAIETTSSWLRTAQNGYARSYALTMFTGVVAFLAALWVIN